MHGKNPAFDNKRGKKQTMMELRRIPTNFCVVLKPGM
jgi:hypothetical protein